LSMSRWRRPHYFAYNQANLLFRNVVAAASFWLIGQSINTAPFKPRANATHLRSGQTQPRRDLFATDTLGGHEDYPCPPNVACSSIWLGDQFLKAFSIRLLQTKRLSCSHGTLLHQVRGQNTSQLQRSRYENRWSRMRATSRANDHPVRALS
jgi:hypothetical protein